MGIPKGRHGNINQEPRRFDPCVTHRVPLTKYTVPPEAFQNLSLPRKEDPKCKKYKTCHGSHKNRGGRVEDLEDLTNSFLTSGERKWLTSRESMWKYIVSIDCEMVRAGPEGNLELARCTAVGPSGEVLLDDLVQPPGPIVDYLTPWSGVTKEMLSDVTTTLEDIQKKLSTMLDPHKTILVGHALENDLHVLQLIYPRIVDTSLLFPHPEGLGKLALRYLVKSYLNENLDRSSGHCSLEDARASLKLCLLKAVRGPSFGGRWDINQNLARFMLPNRQDLFMEKSVDQLKDELRTSSCPQTLERIISACESRGLIHEARMGNMKVAKLRSKRISYSPRGTSPSESTTSANANSSSDHERNTTTSSTTSSTIAARCNRDADSVYQDEEQARPNAYRPNGYSQWGSSRTQQKKDEISSNRDEDKTETTLSLGAGWEDWLNETAYSPRPEEQSTIAKGPLLLVNQGRNAKSFEDQDEEAREAEQQNNSKRRVQNSEKTKIPKEEFKKSTNTFRKETAREERRIHHEKERRELAPTKNPASSLYEAQKWLQAKKRDHAQSRMNNNMNYGNATNRSDYAATNRNNTHDAQFDRAQRKLLHRYSTVISSREHSEAYRYKRANRPQANPNSARNPNPNPNPATKPNTNTKGWMRKRAHAVVEEKGADVVVGITHDDEWKKEWKPTEQTPRAWTSSSVYTTIPASATIPATTIPATMSAGTTSTTIPATTMMSPSTHTVQKVIETPLDWLNRPKEVSTNTTTMSTTTTMTKKKESRDSMRTEFITSSSSSASAMSQEQRRMLEKVAKATVGRPSHNVMVGAPVGTARSGKGAYKVWKEDGHATRERHKNQGSHGGGHRSDRSGHGAGGKQGNLSSRLLINMAPRAHERREGGRNYDYRGELEEGSIYEVNNNNNKTK